ncbi:MAG: hypothetical protein IPG88_19785 [Gemmatimonadetes bacterium]|nr:hypothetical protein [Gemmatimonadota bacterium]
MPITDFLQRELNEGVPATERTDVRLATDGQSLYIAARMYDREPSQIVPGEKIRDVTLSNSDHIALIFDTYHDRQNGFVFATTPAGVEYDGQVIREGEGGGAAVPGQNRARRWPGRLQRQLGRKLTVGIGEEERLGDRWSAG